MSAPTYLDKIIEAQRRRLALTRAARSLEDIRAAALEARRMAKQRAFRAALADESRINIIAEFKRASPSKGVIHAGASAGETARRYEAGGAAALSVLTEEDFFNGSLADLVEVKRSCALPVLRKDFIVEPFQVYEAAEAGADALLLIVAALSDDALKDLRSLTEDELGMDALVEVHTAEEMRRAGAAGATLIGVNNRDLRTFQVSLEVSAELAPVAPPGAMLVSESGLRDAADISFLRGHSFRAFLIGETLMRAGRPEDVLRELINVR
jgi:indole-3-glycerol phosphate synthase